MQAEIEASKMTAFKGGHTFLFWRQREFLDAVLDFLELHKTELQNSGN